MHGLTLHGIMGSKVHVLPERVAWLLLGQEPMRSSIAFTEGKPVS